MQRFEFLFFFFNDTATTEIYTLSLHDALPISGQVPPAASDRAMGVELTPVRELNPKVSRRVAQAVGAGLQIDRKSTRLNSSHANISYAVFCLKKKKKYKTDITVIHCSPD